MHLTCDNILNPLNQDLKPNDLKEDIVKTTFMKLTFKA